MGAIMPINNLKNAKMVNHFEKDNNNLYIDHREVKDVRAKKLAIALCGKLQKEVKDNKLPDLFEVEITNKELQSIGIDTDKQSKVLLKRKLSQLTRIRYEIGEDNGNWEAGVLFNRVRYNEDNGTIAVSVVGDNFNSIKQFTNSYFVIESKKIKQLSKSEHINFYEKCVSYLQRKEMSIGKLTISFEDFKKDFGIENKYKTNSDFNKFVNRLIKIIEKKTDIKFLNKAIDFKKEFIYFEFCWQNIDGSFDKNIKEFNDDDSKKRVRDYDLSQRQKYVKPIYEEQDYEVLSDEEIEKLKEKIRENE